MSSDFSKSASSAGRLTIGLPVAALVSVGLFLGMAAMIRSEGAPSPPPPERDGIVLPEVRTELDPTRLEPIDPTKIETPPPPDTRPDSVDRPQPGPSDIGPRPTPGGDGPIDLPQPPFSADLAILQFAPDYPPTCLNRGEEGYAVVVFDVTTAGDVINARVVESSNRCFERPSLRAIERWKFNPTAGDSGIAARGVRKVFRFQITG